MPNHQTAEYAVIGCVLIDERCFPVVREILPTAEPFSNGNCRRTYETICALADGQKPIDPVTVSHATGLEHEFFEKCMEIAPTCAGAAEYASIVKEGHKRRQLYEIGEKLHTGAFCHDTDADHILANARAALDALARSEGYCSVKSPNESLMDFLQFRADVNEGKRQTVTSGFPSLDGVLGGFAPGGLYIIAARPGVGKSALGIAMADMLAKKTRVLYVSLEMTVEELNARRVAAFTDTPCSTKNLLFDKSTEAEDTAVINACGVLAQRQLHISATSQMTVSELGIHAQNVMANVVIVDYLGLLAGENPKASEYERITQVSGDLKRMAKRLNCVVLALCQLNRESVNSPGSSNEPKLSQLRSSGAIEQDADGVLLLHRPEYGQQNIERDPTAPQSFFVNIAKNRHGRTGMIELKWYAQKNRFEDRGGRWTVKSWI